MITPRMSPSCSRTVPIYFSCLSRLGRRASQQKRRVGSSSAAQRRALEDDQAAAQQACGSEPCDQAVRERTSHGAEPDRWYASAPANWGPMGTSEHWTDAVVATDSRLKDAIGQATGHLPDRTAFYLVRATGQPTGHENPAATGSSRPSIGSGGQADVQWQGGQDQKRWTPIACTRA
jgi:hypothetical protein